MGVYLGGPSPELIDSSAADDVVRRHYAGEIDINTAVTRLAEAFRDLPVRSGLSMLQLQYVPMVHIHADSVNRLGHAMAEFATKLAPVVSRERIVQKFGPLRHFLLRTTQPDALAVIQAALNEGDREPVLGLAPRLDAQADLLEFECPVKLKTLVEILKDCDAGELAKGLSLVSSKARQA